MVSTAIGAGVFGLLWYTRALQVATFAAAASAARSRRKPRIGPAEQAAQWTKVPHPVSRTRTSSEVALVTYHPDYQEFDPRQALVSLDAACRLGVGWIRTDIRWNYLLPDGIRPDTGALNWYRDFLNVLRGYGLKSLAVLSTPPSTVLALPQQEKIGSWNWFVEIAARELGPLCDAFQLMNELNNPAYAFLPQKETADALTRGAAIIRSRVPSAQVAINVTTDLWGWQNYLERLLHLSGQAVNIVGLDHYPGTWSVGFSDRWSQIVELVREVASAPESSPWHGRRLIIMETGYSTNFIGRRENSQAEYFEGVLEVARKLKAINRADDPYLGIYELCDENSRAWLDPEAHFGLMTSDLQPKRAFAVVAEALRSL